jgi:hypothetical protein
MTATADETLTAWFWVMTLQYRLKDGTLAAGTANGSAAIPASDTRRDAFEGILSEARRRLNVRTGEYAAVLCFYLEPAELDAGSRP